MPFENSHDESSDGQERGDGPAASALPGWLAAVCLGLAGLILLVLPLMGRVWWCAAGDLSPWSWDVWSRHNSQHLIDPYTLSHVQHGLGLLLVLEWLFANRMSQATRIAVVAAVETLWEIVENTPWLIARYRAETMALNYEGDSVLNALCDYGACMMGVWLALRLPAQVTIALFVVLELACVLWIRDSLLLNILMLVWPIEAVQQWQTTGV